ncbi:hypothetical protein PRIPAC_88909 [Pristionchus pacificus]|nr:hypothetical protein PRIPAC_88909 [Pristionchus pacificus]
MAAVSGEVPPPTGTASSEVPTPATSPIPSGENAATPVTGETGTNTQEGGINGTQSKEGGEGDKDPVSFTDRDATTIGKMMKKVRKNKKKKKKKKGSKYKYTTDRFESNLFLMRLEGTLFCGGILAFVMLLSVNLLLVTIIAIMTGGNIKHYFE